MRLLGEIYTGESRPLIIVLSGIHGNEVAGIQATKYFFDHYKTLIHITSDHEINLNMVGIIGNLNAFNQNKRYIDIDLNRIWTPQNLQNALAGKISSTGSEFKEFSELVIILKSYIEARKPTKIYFLDLHTTSASDGIFAITNNEVHSVQLARCFQADIILGLLDYIPHTTLDFFNRIIFDYPSLGIAYEAGSHFDPLSVDRSVQVILTLFNNVNSENTSNCKFNARTVNIVYRYEVQDINTWQMLDGFKNFDMVKNGQHLATDGDKKITSPYDGYIIMPLYQKIGIDGFFIAVDYEK